MSESTLSSWPPYGFMPERFRVGIDRFPVPQGFTLEGELANAQQYTAYVESEAKTMADFLWPIYDPLTHEWKGRAAETAVRLTETDLRQMRALRARMGQEAKCGNRGLGATHGQLFHDEDMDASGTVDRYMSDLAPELLGALRVAIQNSFPRLGATHLRFKEKFQRPRAYQVTALKGEQYKYEFAASAVTPAMISGHCLQGLLVRTCGYMDVRNQLNEEQTACMQQYCVDIGDRRVFAGVHYPSDNIGSWYCALRLCEHLFDRQPGDIAKKFMWAAIQRSAVFAAVKQEAQSEESPYHLPLRVLKDEAERRLVP